MYIPKNFTENIYGKGRTHIRSYIKSLQDTTNDVIVSSSTLQEALNKLIEVGNIYKMLPDSRKHQFIVIIEYLVTLGLNLDKQPLETLNYIDNKHMIKTLFRMGLSPLDTNNTPKYISYYTPSSHLCKALVRWYIKNNVTYKQIQDTGHPELLYIANRYIKYVTNTPRGEQWLEWRNASFKEQVNSRLAELERDIKNISQYMQD